MFPLSELAVGVYVVVFLLFVLTLVISAHSVHRIGPNEVGLVVKRWGPVRTDESPVAMAGEAGYQADLLMPGIAIRFWPLNRVEKHPWVQIPTG